MPTKPRSRRSIGDLETLEGRYDEARSAYATAAALVLGAALAVVEHKWALVELRAGDWGAADSHLDSALRELGQSAPGTRARILAAQAAVPNAPATCRPQPPSPRQPSKPPP